jgi:universal stress protein E
MKTFNNILYVLEDTSDYPRTLARIIALAEAHRAKLTILDVVAAGAVEDSSEIFAYHATAIDPLVAPHRKNLTITVSLALGITFVEVIRTVLRNDHDLVIKVTETPDYLQRLFGSTDMHLLRKCPCPLWLIKPGEPASYERVLAAVDFDPPPNTNDSDDDLNRLILSTACAMAAAHGASLHLVHAWEPFAEGKMRSRTESHESHLERYLKEEYAAHQGALSALVESLKKTLDQQTFSHLNLGLHLPKGPALRAIPQLADELSAGIVVMGTVARTGIPGLIIGNTAEAILDQLQCSVLAVKPPGFVTPVQPTP